MRNNGHDYITYPVYYYDDYSDGISIANVEAHVTGEGIGNGFFLQYNLVKIGNGCFALLSDDNTTCQLSNSVRGWEYAVYSRFRWNNGYLSLLGGISL